MTFSIDTSDIHLNNPYPAGQAFAFEFHVHNTGGLNTTGHTDHVDIWDQQSTKMLDENITAPPVQSGQDYHTVVQVPALAAGGYDVAVNVDGGTASAGATIHVQ